MPIAQGELRGRVAWVTGSSRGLGRVIAGYLALPYSASITPDASQANFQSIPVNNATAFTVNAPTNPPTATGTQDLTLEINNTTAAAIGAATFAAGYVLTNGAWVQPATLKKRQITFRWNSAAWVESVRSTSDY